ncbi:hypothetical protein VNO80_06106 [Phaseolus coccineus]|uniref:PGG domain-containing protein n=1 Tax=Phaseolus coccineus TaxID=3886 RepID=A0AAN9NGA7_PHACN
MEPIVKNDPNSVLIPLTGSGDTALHVAAGAGNTTFVKELTKLMKPEDQLIPNSEGMLAVHLAALSGHHRIVNHLCSDWYLLDKMAYKDIEKLFFMTIGNDMLCKELHCQNEGLLLEKEMALVLCRKGVGRVATAGAGATQTDPTCSCSSTCLYVFKLKYLCIIRDIDLLRTSKQVQQYSTPFVFMRILHLKTDAARKIFRRCPELSTARDKEELTALHMLARKPSTVLRTLHFHFELEDDKHRPGWGIILLKRIWAEVRKLRIEDFFVLITRPSVALSDAIKSESDHEVMNTFLDILKTVVEEDPNGRNLLHLLFLHRRYEIFLTFESNRIEQLLLVGDNEGNSVLHLAALFPIQFQSFSGLSAYIQMSLRNKKGMRPIDVFYDEHNQLSKDIKEAAKGIADSGMIVATLVATVAFAAALTVPGDKNNAWFIVFIFTNAVALFTSSASILSFLSYFTSSRFAQTEFVVSLHPRTFGLVLLIISVAAMVLAFIAASFLVFAHTTKWVSYTVAPMGVFALLLFVLFQSKFCDDHFWSSYYRPKLD